MTAGFFLEDKNTEEFYFDYDKLLQTGKMLFRDGYYLGANNNFVRLFTITGRKYWLAQASCNYLLPDWKIHFSIVKEDVAKAFNLLSQLYFEMKGPFGLKATYPDQFKDYNNIWPEKMKGREITVYIFVYANLKSNKSAQIMEYLVDDTTQHHVPYGYKDCSYHVIESDPYNTFDISKEQQVDFSFYLEFIDRAEGLLQKYNIRTNGCANGDYAIPGCTYASLRNEKFCIVSPKQSIECEMENQKTNLVYPPNACGYNSSNDDDLSLIFNLQQYRKQKQKNQFLIKSSLLVLSSILIATTIWRIKNRK